MYLILAFAVVAEIAALALGHYWPERGRWSNVQRYIYGTICVALPWSLIVAALPVSRLGAIALYWAMVLIAGASTWLMYNRVDPWLKFRSRGRMAGSRQEVNHGSS